MSKCGLHPKPFNTSCFPKQRGFKYKDNMGPLNPFSLHFALTEKSNHSVFKEGKRLFQK